MNTQSKPLRRVRHLGRVTKDINRQATDRRQEYFDIRPGDQLGVHAARELEEGSPQGTLVDPEPLGNAREIPDRLDGYLGHGKLALRVQADLAVGYESSAPDALLQLGELHVSLCDGDGWSEIHFQANM